MQDTKQTQRIVRILDDDYYISIWIESFLVSKRVEGCVPRTISFYRQKLALFEKFLDLQVIIRFDQITTNVLREYFLWLGDSHNDGGVHACYRVLKVFLRWWENEVEPENWHNPLRKVKVSEPREEPLEPLDLQDLKAMLSICDHNFTGVRDRAIMLSLLDLGCRASEFLAINLDDLDLAKSQILLRHTKNRKIRIAYLGRRSRREIRHYLRRRDDDSSALWVTIHGTRLAYDGLRALLVRRARQSGLDHTPTPHQWRRAFALSLLRSGVDLFTLKQLTGHESTRVLQRYLKLTNQDAENAHRRASPVDNAF